MSIRIFGYLLKVSTMKPHVAIERGYVLELAMAQVALDRFDVARRSRARGARRPACARALRAPTFLTPLLRLSI